MTHEELQFLRDNLHRMSDAEKAETLDLLDELESRATAERCRSSLLEFITTVDKEYKIGVHHKALAEIFEDMAFGRAKINDTGSRIGHVRDRVTVAIAPRMGKSMMSSIYFPAWFIGNFPSKKIMMVSHTSDLAVDFGRKVRNLVASDKYKKLFPDVQLSADSKSAGRWDTQQGGTYFACGVGSALAGRGADLLCIDDPNNEQDILSGNLDVFNKTYDWYALGARTRLMPGGRVAVIQTRWAKNDLTGRIIDDMTKNPGGDKWEVLEFPALINGKSLWPEQWTTESLLRTKASMPAYQWNSQYMQNPTAAEGSIIKKHWWRRWKEQSPPECSYVIMSLDTAAEKTNRADFTALTTWGVFEIADKETGKKITNIMLLDAVNERLEYPELKRVSLEKYEEYKPDWFIVEKKNSGVVLYQEMRANGLPVQEFTPHRGSGDKFARLNAVSDIFSSGFVWYPEGRRWAEEVVDQVCEFPAARHDDLCDSTVMAIARFRSGGFITLPSDEVWDDDSYIPITRAYY